MLVRIHDALHESAIDILRNKEHCLVEITCILSNGDTGLSVNVDLIDELKIVHNFSASYYDDITLSIKLKPIDVFSLLSNQQNLRCHLELARYDRNLYSIIPDIPPMEIDTIVLLENNTDITKIVNEAELILNEQRNDPTNDAYESIRIPLTLQLIEESAYNLKHYKINFMLKDSAIEDAIYFALQKMEITESSIIPSDNKEKIPEIVVPPVHGIDSIFPFLQKNYGIYAKGMSYYFMKDIFYMYPEYDPDPKSAPNVCHIYSVPKNTYIGSDGYYARKGQDIWILANTDIELDELVEAGIENTGNSSVSQDVTNIVDSKSETTNERTKLIPNTVAIEPQIDENKGMTKNTRNLTYDPAVNNKYVASSKMASFGGGLIKIGCINIDPWIILPGMKLVFHYEKKRAYETHVGMIIDAQIVFKPAHKPAKIVFGNQGLITARLNPDDPTSYSFDNIA